MLIEVQDDYACPSEHASDFFTDTFDSETGEPLSPLEKGSRIRLSITHSILDYEELPIAESEGEEHLSRRGSHDLAASMSLLENSGSAPDLREAVLQEAKDTLSPLEDFGAPYFAGRRRSSDDIHDINAQLQRHRFVSGRLVRRHAKKVCSMSDCAQSS